MNTSDHFKWTFLICAISYSTLTLAQTQLTNWAIGPGGNTSADNTLISSLIQYNTGEVSNTTFILIPGFLFPIDSEMPVVQIGSFPAFYTIGGGVQNASIVVSDNSGLLSSATVSYKGVSEATSAMRTFDFTNPAVGSFEFDVSKVETQIKDPLGIEYIFELIDAAGNSAMSQLGRTHLHYPATSSLSIPYSSFGSGVSNYRMISVPLNLATPSISANLSDELGPVDNTKWKVMRYVNGNTTDISSNGRFELGKGYWIIIKNSTPINVGEGKTPQVSASSPQIISLVQGWNQIGNPYNFNLRWADVIAFNNITTEIDADIITYNGSYNSQTTFTAKTGAFVFASQSISLSIPVTLDAAINGRYASSDNTSDTYDNALDEDTWEVMFNLERGGHEFNLGGIGMHPDAQENKDMYDRIAIPRFLEFLDLSFNHPEFFSPWFRKDIVNTRNEYQWEFIVESNVESDYTTLSWDNSYFGDNPNGLLLIDTQTGQIINMRMQNEYIFAGAKRIFQVHFGDNNLLANQLPKEFYVNSYPNPFEFGTTFQINLPDSQKDYQITVDIYNSIGQKMINLINGVYKPGQHPIYWNGRDKSGISLNSGLYLYRVNIYNDKDERKYVGRIIKR